MILSHQGEPQLLDRLVGSILNLSPQASVLVYHDARRHEAPRIGYSRAKAVAHTHHSDWGSWELVEATLEGLETARTLFDPEMVVLISGQDYPVRDLSEWEEEFLSDGGGWMGSVNPLNYKARWGWKSGSGDRLLRRYTYRWFTLPFSRQLLSDQIPAKAFRRALGLIAKYLDPVFSVHALQPARRMFIGFRDWRSPLRHGVQCYYGSQWVAMDRERLDLLLERHKKDDHLRDVYRHSLIPDESYIQTILASIFPVRPGPPISYYKYDRSRTRGVILTLEDFSGIVRSGSPFCRKASLEEAGRELLDRLDLIQVTGTPHQNGSPGG